MSRRSGIKTQRGLTPGQEIENFPFNAGEEITCNNTETGETVTGIYKSMTKSRERILVVVNGKQRWLKLADIVVTRY